MCSRSEGVGMPCWHRTDARMRERSVWCYPLSTSPSVLDLTCSVYYIPPRRACFDGPPSLFSTCEEEEDTCTRALTLSSFPTITV